MLFMKDIKGSAGAKEYYSQHLSPSDYYLQDALQMHGEWHGYGAEIIGLEGPVHKQQFFDLCDNINPMTGEALTARTKIDRRVMTDFTFDVPKSVSLAYEIGRDDRILEAFKDSIRETMGEIEASVQARVRKAGADSDRQTGNFIWTEHIHRTSRPVDGVPDLQLHAHATAFNATFDPIENRWKAAQLADVYRDKGYFQAAFHSRMAQKLDGLGYEIERDGKSFRLAGIDEETCAKFSRRTAIIEAKATALGLTNAKVKGELGRKTRENKNDDNFTLAELREEWNKRLTDGERQAITSARSGKDTRTLSADRAMDYALLHGFERASVLTEKELITTALIHGVGSASVHDVWSESRRDNILRKNVKGQNYVTTKEVYQDEQAMLQFARAGRGKHKRLGTFKRFKVDEGLSREQEAASLAVLNSRDRVVGIHGGAGTGKTRMMQKTIAAIEEGGKKVYTFAPSSKAARGVLRQEGFENADTLAKLLNNPEMQRKVHGQVLWLDEAGMCSVGDMKKFLSLAKDQECRVVLSGDSNQHNSVARGDAMRLLERDAGVTFATLKEIRRQTNADYRKAVEHISEGDVLAKDGRTRLEHGMEQLSNMGAVAEMPGEERYLQLAFDYASATGELNHKHKPKTAIVVSPTHREAERATEAIREALRVSGRLGTKEHDFLSLKGRSLSEAEKGDAANYRTGDVIQYMKRAPGIRQNERMTVMGVVDGKVTVRRQDGFEQGLNLGANYQVFEAKEIALTKGDKLHITKNGQARETRWGRKNRLNNGDIYEVAGFTKAGDIKLANGFVVPKDYGQMTHGYVVTSHASQGATVDKVLVALGEDSFAAANRQQFYVSVSRGREAVKLYTNDKEAMFEAVKSNAARLSATELLENREPVKKRPAGIMQRLFATQRIQRAYTAVKERIAAVRQREVSLGY